MQSVIDKSKEYELLIVKHDPIYSDIVKAIDIVKQFITDNGLIIYGGTAIDYALRLHGDQIYPDDMLTVPDLDFYSPNNTDHAYQLADLLFHAGYVDARAINAMHMETMRVDIGNNHFVADISYRPQIAFDKLLYVKYNGMKVLHPTYQRIDIHSALSFPFDNPPREVIFDRWQKDIKRFNKMDKYYPLESEGNTVGLPEIVTDISHGYVYTGFVAYAVLYHRLAEVLGNVPIDVVNPHMRLDGTTMKTNGLCVEFVHHNPAKFCGKIGLKGTKHYEPYINLIPERYEGLMNGKLVVYSTKNKLLSMNIVKVGDTNVKVANIQYLLRHFLAMYLYHAESTHAMTYLRHYTSLLQMARLAEDKVPGYTVEELLDFPFMCSVYTYGDRNINLSSEVAFNYLAQDLDKATPYKIPKNYYPGKSIARGLPHPPFDPELVEFFRESGREIVD